MLRFRQFKFLLEGVVDDVKKKYRETSLEGKTSNPPGFNLLDRSSKDSHMIPHIMGHPDAQTYVNRAQGNSNSLYHHPERVRNIDDMSTRSSNGRLTDHIIDQLAHGDPAKDKKHLPQIADWYAQGHFRAEDLGSAASHKESPNWNTVHGTLAAFSDIKNADKLPNIPHPDPAKQRAGQTLKGTRLSSYAHMSFGQFRSHVHKALGLDKASSGNIADHPDIEHLGEHEGTHLYQIHSEGAAKHAAKCFGAKWCTGWERDNQFEHYSDNLLLAHHSDGTVHQIHSGSNQFMDKEDEPVDVKKAAEQYPGLGKFKQVQHFQDENGDFPLLPHEERKAAAEHYLNKFHNGDGSHSTMMAIVKLGDHDQLKNLEKQHLNAHVASSLTARNVVAAHSKMRRMHEFGDKQEEFRGEKGSAEHLGSILARHHELNDLTHNLGRSITHPQSEHLKNIRHKLEHEFNTNFGHQNPQGTIRPLAIAAHQANEMSDQAIHPHFGTDSRKNYDPIKAGKAFHDYLHSTENRNDHPMYRMREAMKTKAAREVSPEERQRVHDAMMRHIRGG